MDDLLNDAPLALLGAAFFAALMLASAFGGWLAQRRAEHGGANPHDYVLSGVMGLLALLIAFTFGMALERFETRRALVVAEANAIGTAEMRVRLLDAPASLRLAGLYRQYAETRLRYGQVDAENKPPLLATSQALRARIQAETLQAVRPVRDAPLATLVMPAVNESLDIGIERESAQAARLPSSVVAAVGVYALVAAGILGSAVGAGRSQRLMTAALLGLLTLAMSLILDLDRPQRGAIHISQAPMAALVAGFAATPLPAATGEPPSPTTPASLDAGGSSRPSAR